MSDERAKDALNAQQFGRALALFVNCTGSVMRRLIQRSNATFYYVAQIARDAMRRGAFFWRSFILSDSADSSSSTSASL
jgi:hypothetical protein